MDVQIADIAMPMLIPVIGMVFGLLFAVFISYRKPRQYQSSAISTEDEGEEYQTWGVIFSFVAIIVTMVVQIVTDSMVFGAISGITVLCT